MDNAYWEEIIAAAHQLAPEPLYKLLILRGLLCSQVSCLLSVSSCPAGARLSVHQFPTQNISELLNVMAWHPLHRENGMHICSGFTR